MRCSIMGMAVRGNARRLALAAGALAIGLGTAPALAAGPRPPAAPAAQLSPLPVREEAAPHRGEASIYHDRFQGRPMANGDRFDQRSDSAASKQLPLDSRAQVKNLENGRTAEVSIEDRGPHVRGRVIDLSEQTARQLGVEDGTAPVEVRPLPGGKRD